MGNVSGSVTGSVRTQLIAHDKEVTYNILVHNTCNYNYYINNISCTCVWDDMTLLHNHASSCTQLCVLHMGNFS